MPLASILVSVSKASVGTSAKLTAQILWERGERRALSELCLERGISVDEIVGGRTHEDTPEFKAKKAALGELDAAIGERTSDLQEVSASLSEVETEQRRVAADTAKLKKESDALSKELAVKRRAHAQDIAGLAAPVPPLLSLTHRNFVMVKKDDWEQVAAQARSEFVSSSQLAAEKKRRQQVESDNAERRREVEPLRLKVRDLTSENELLRDRIRSLQKIIVSVLDYLRTRIAPAIFEAVDRLIDAARAPEHKHFREPPQRHERGGRDAPEM